MIRKFAPAPHPDPWRGPMTNENRASFSDPYGLPPILPQSSKSITFKLNQDRASFSNTYGLPPILSQSSESTTFNPNDDRASFLNTYGLPPVPSQSSESTKFNPNQIRTHTNHPPPPYSAQDESSIEAQRAFFILIRNRTFLTFLSSYGPDGVSLRELIMLATLRQAGRESRNHWLMSGEVGTFEEATAIIPGRINWVFGSFLKDGVVDSSAVQSFQKLLESLDFIDVRYPEDPQSDEAVRYWHTDERVWVIRGSELSEPSAPIDDFSVLWGLLDLLIGMPDKDVSPAAQRQREVYYYHAHLLIRRVIRSQGFLKKHPSLLMQAVFVTLQLLTHRYQIGDSLLLDFVREYSVGFLHLNENVMLLWAELKENAFREDYDGLCTIRDRALNLVNSNDGQSYATPRNNGFLGLVLVDFMNSAKALHFKDLVADALEAGKKWVDSAPRNGTSIEKTVLCEMLATFDIHARNEIIQKEHYLFYGYHLSRAGFLEQGDNFLARGLEGRDSLSLWSYEMERVSNALRLGRQNEAAQMLKSLRELALQCRDTGPIALDVNTDMYEVRQRSVLWNHPGKRAENWKGSGECSETFILLYLYEADCSASVGRLDDACAKLKSGISITSSVYDAYIRILRVTLEMRLVEILMRQGRLEEALPVALNLTSEILDERTSSTLAPQTVYGIVQQSLDLSSSLLSAENAAASMALLKSITDTGALLHGESSKEIELYVEQRMAKARQFSESIELSGHHQTPSTLDTGIENPITLVKTNPNPTIPKAIEEAALMSGALEPPSSSQTWKTGVEDPITHVQIDPGNEQTVPKRKEKVYLANASFPARLPNSTKFQTKARKRSERDKQLSFKALQSKKDASTLDKLRGAPRPPSTEPDKFESASEEKIMKQEEIPSRI